MNVGEQVINFLLCNARYEDARFQEDTLSDLAPEARGYLLKSRMLVKTGKMASCIFEYGEPVKVQTVYGSCPPCYFFIDGNETIDVPASRLELYAGDYGPLAGMVKRDFATKNPVQVLIPGLLWMCGNAGRQQREVFLARNAGKDANVTACLKQQPDRSVVLQIGIPDKSLSERFNEAQVCQVSDILSWENDGLALDRSVIAARIDDMLEKQGDVKQRRGKKYLEYMEVLRYILLGTFRFYLENARRVRRGSSFIPMPSHARRVRRGEYRIEDFNDQRSLALSSCIPESTLSHIIKEWREYSQEEHNMTFLALLDFLTGKQKSDTGEVFDFFDRWKQKLYEVGFKDGVRH